MTEYVPSAPPRVVDPTWAWEMPTLRPEGVMSVAGVRYRQDVLRNHLEGARPLGFVTAQLLRDDKNPHHSGAVAVFLGSDHVGYVPRDCLEDYAGKAFYNALARLRDTWTPATCWAQFRWEESGIGLDLLTGYTGDYGQERKLDDPRPFPITVPPGWARSQVLGTAESQEALKRSLGRKSQTDVPVGLTVADADPNRPRGGGPVLLVGLAGEAIGALSAKNSAPVIPIVEYLGARDCEAIALAWLRPSSGARGGLVCSVFACGSLGVQPEQPAERQLTETATHAPAGWHPDPTGRHEQRYWDGTAWSPHVFDGGVQSVDPV